jgi:hypothetical protein
MGLKPDFLHDVVNPRDDSPDVVEQVCVVESRILYGWVCENVLALTFLKRCIPVTNYPLNCLVRETEAQSTVANSSRVKSHHSCITNQFIYLY